MSKANLHKIVILGILIFLLPLAIGLVEGFFCIRVEIFHELGRSIFGSREVMWLALTILFTSGGLLFSLIWQRNVDIEKDIGDKKIMRYKLILGMQQELINNFISTFKTKLNVSIETTFYDKVKANMDFIPDKPLFNHVILIYSIVNDFKVAQILFKDNIESLLEEKFESMYYLWLFLIKTELVNKDMGGEIEKRVQSIMQLRQGKLLTSEPLSRSKEKQVLTKKYRDIIQLLDNYFFEIKKNTYFNFYIYKLVVDVFIKEDDIRN